MWHIALNLHNISKELKMGKELKDQRISVMFSKSELELLDDWMFAKRIRSRGEAVRQMCQQAIVKDLGKMKEAKIKAIAMESSDD